VNAQDFRARDTPLMITVCNGSADCSRVLLKYGADPRAVNVNGQTAEVRHN
jgi:ankyrin repeat protein